jgi:hypothetical protein
MGNGFEQSLTAGGFIAGKLGAIGDVVKKQIQSSVFSRQSSGVGLQSLPIPTTAYGLVLAISGTASPTRFGWRTPR